MPTTKWKEELFKLGITLFLAVVPTLCGLIYYKGVLDTKMTEMQSEITTLKADLKEAKAELEGKKLNKAEFDMHKENEKERYDSLKSWILRSYSRVASLVSPDITSTPDTTTDSRPR